MSERGRSEISARLRRLPKEFLLALINATAILAIVAAIVVLVAIERIDNFAGRLTSAMTQAVLAKVDLPSRDVLANLTGLREDVRSLRDAIREAKASENPILQSKIPGLTEALAVLDMHVDRLANARTVLADEVIGRLGQSVTDALTSMRGCAPRATLKESPAREQFDESVGNLGG